MSTNCLKQGPLGLVFVFVLNLALVVCQQQEMLHLRGLTILDPPFLERGLDGKLTGFYLDMLDEIARLGRFNYTLDVLQLANEQIHRDMMHNDILQFAGLLKELQNRRRLEPNVAFFALASHLTGSNRIPGTEITEPYLTSGLGALVRRSVLEPTNVQNMSDLLDERRFSPPPDIEMKDPPIPIVLGTTYRMRLQLDNSPIKDAQTSQIYQRVQTNPSGVVYTVEEGVNRTLTDPYALVQEQLVNELAMGKHCNLTQLVVQTEEPEEGQIKYRIRIAAPGHELGKLVSLFNGAIREMKANGRMEELRRKHWSLGNICNNAHSHVENWTNIETLFSMTILMFVCTQLN